MTVYAAIFIWQYIGQDLASVHASHDGARAAIEAQMRTHYGVTGLVVWSGDDAQSDTTRWTFSGEEYRGFVERYEVQP